MEFNYGLILLLASLLTGLICIADIFRLKPARKKNAAAYRLIITPDNINQSEIDAILKEPFLVDFSRSFFPVIFFILIVRSFLYEPFRIPSGSMKPTLLAGDFILVEKFSYGLRMPGFHQLLYATGSPEYGDVVVFRYPLDPKEHYIKRVVGLPGDKVSYQNKQITIQTTNHSKSRQIEQKLLAAAFSDAGELVDIYQEKLGLDWHNILLNPNAIESLTNNQWTVPAGHYFVMGDNRDNSNDSRYWGFVSQNDLVGKAQLIWLHLEFKNTWIDWLPSAITFQTAGRIR